MIAVLDTNIYISAFISPAGPPGQVVQALISGRFEARATERLWGEVIRVLEEPKIRAIFERRGDAGRIATLAERLRNLVGFVDLEPPTAAWVAADPDDDWIIQCALTASAERLVTGDAHLLAVDLARPPLRIVSPASFLAALEHE